MKASELRKALLTLATIRQPAFVWGPPGVGKSAVMKQVADELYGSMYGGHIDEHERYHDKTGKFAPRPYFRDVRLPTLDPVDLRGLPHINGDGQAHWCAPDFLPKDGCGLIFLDEANAAVPLVQAASYQLVQDFAIGEYQLPEGWTPMLAGNRESDKAVTFRLPSPLANKVVHIEYTLDVNDWVSWAITKPFMLTEVIAFIRFRNECLFTFDPKRDDKAFATPRTIEKASRILQVKPDPSIEYELLCGTVGERVATELLGFIRVYRTMPNIDLVMSHPDTAPVPDELSTLYALSLALARKASQNTMDRVVTYANRLPNEFSVLLMRDATEHAPDCVHTRAYIDWATKHDKVLS